MRQIIILPRGQFTPLSKITIPGLISSFINIFLILASLLFVFNLLMGGIKIILSGGEKEALDTAKRQILNSLLGIVIVFSSWAILLQVSQFFGVNLLVFEIPIL